MGSFHDSVWTICDQKLGARKISWDEFAPRSTGSGGLLS